MKTFIVFVLFSTFAFATPNATKRILPVTKEQEALKKEKLAKDKIKAITKEEDCDDKAKKPVEITPESISLSGMAGCSLDEAKPK